MRLNNRILAIAAGAAMIAVVGGAAIAQTSGAGRFLAERGGRLAAAMGLSDPQRQEMRQLRREAREQAKAIRNDGSLSVDQKIAKLDALREQTKQKAMAAMTPEQRAAWEAKVASKKAGWEGKKAAFAKDLGLTEAQMTALKAVRDEFRTEARRTMLHSSLSRDQIKAKMQQIRAAKENEVKGILTPDQFAKWQAKKAEMKDKRDKRRSGDGAPANRPSMSPTAVRV